MASLVACGGLDRRVAQVLGVPLKEDANVLSEGAAAAIYPFMPANWSPWVVFNPSTDLNVAFAAAEWVGLFSETFWRTLGMDELGETWGVFEQDGCVKTSVAGEHDTPALAICAAILKLKGVSDDGRAERVDA